MAVDKSLMEAPQGIAAMAAEMEPIEIEIVKHCPFKIGTMRLLSIRKSRPRAEEFDANLADFMGDERVADALPRNFLGHYEQDLPPAKIGWIHTLRD